MQSMSSLMTISFGVSNGSAALAITRAFQATAHRCLPGADPSRGDKPTQCEIALLSKEKNGQDRCWPATLHFNCFTVA